MSPIDQELEDLYHAERPGMDRNIVAAFVNAGLEPPSVDRWTATGPTAAERLLIDKFYETHEPHGSRKVTAE